jgi:bifunctional non-homologous end joining protein LigD
MSLKEYDKKRDFNKTAEPKAGKPKSNVKLRFVIQKHDASRLHYDFRLEMEGVLKSWAVPKGPSTDPKNKRLAMMVEDHPYDYKNFEGIIPKGEYGGGTVMVWDEGYYEPIEKIRGKKAQEKHLLKQLKEGSLKIILHGKKLNGEFALVRTNGMGENSWLLIKHKDDFASSADITKKDKSVLSDKTMKQLEKSGSKQEEKNAEQKTKDSLKGKKTTAEKVVVDHFKETDNTKIKKGKIPNNIQVLIKKGKKSTIPIGMKPMLATLVDKPFDDKEWLYEIKWDGYRALGFSLKNGDVQLLSRNNKPFNEKFYPIYDVMKTWEMDMVVDGEILVIDDKGISNFGKLQNWRSETDGDLVYYVFDLIWCDGKDLSELPLIERQEILAQILPQDDDRIRISKVFKAKGSEFFDAAVKNGLEGIIAKKANSEYLKNFRSTDWLKIKVNQRQEVVIAGFTKNGGTSKLFSSLLLGVYENKDLKFVGKVGTGFNVKDQKEMMEQFESLITEKSPFSELPDVNKSSRFRPNPPKTDVTWLKPKLVCEVQFTEVTNDGVFRHPSFQGMRLDKQAKDIVRESTVETNAIVKTELPDDMESKPIQKDHLTSAIKPPKSIGRKTLLNPKDEIQVRKINGNELKFTSLSKLYWPKDKVSKRDMFNYYYQIADYILPYLKDRPMSLNRYPGGIHAKSFYQKDVREIAPDWADTFPYTTSDGEAKEYLVGNNDAALLWMASLGCIEMNPWFSRTQYPDHPDYCVIDLDPDKNTFDQVIRVAQIVKEVLDKMEVPSYPKTSGSTGIHIYIPLGAKYSYDQSQMFAKIIVNLVHQQVPDFTTLERMVANRNGKMYLDFLQNRPGATIAGPYSLRPKEGATVSMPLSWEEVKVGMKMKDFTIFNTIDCLKEKGDLFKGVLGKGIDMTKAINKAKEVFG